MNIKKRISKYFNTKWRSPIRSIDLDAVKFLGIGKKIKLGKQEHIRKQYQTCIDELILNCKESNKSIVTALLKNQLNHILQQAECQQSPAGDKSVGINLFYLKLTASVAERIQEMSCLIGVQPMTGPVGLIYKMKYKNNAEQEEQEAGNMREIYIEIISAAVEARSRKLQAIFSIEAMQDCSILHPGINFEKEITNILADEVIMEIVNEILFNLVAFATPTIKTIIRRADDTVYLHAKHMMSAIHRASYQIAAATRRGKGNVIVCSPDSYEALRRVIHMQSTVTMLSLNPYNDGTISDFIYAGDIVTADNKIIYKIYVTNYLEVQGKHRFLIGYKGVSETDAGMWYCPYVAIMSTGVVIDPTTFQPQIRLMTRYGIHSDIETAGYENAQNYYRIVDVDPIDMLQIVA